MNNRLITTAICLSLLFSCSGTKKEEEKITAESSYIKAMDLLKDHSFGEAAKEFDKIDDEFPFSKWAMKSKIMTIYAYYKDEEFEKVISSADDFLRLNANSDYASYALYMKGLSFYNRIPSIDRAQNDTQQASFAFRELLARFPISSYAQDAREKIAFIDEHLAGAKMSIGRYQIKVKNYVGALASFNEVIGRYRQTKQIAEAYFRLGEIYDKIGLKKEAAKAKEHLQSQFPNSYFAKYNRDEK
jgi:outer membrane protein assembly factor BamD